MGFILVPNSGEDIQVSGWDWRPTLELLRHAGLLEGEAYERMGAQGCGGCAMPRSPRLLRMPWIKSSLPCRRARGSSPT